MKTILGKKVHRIQFYTEPRNNNRLCGTIVLEDGSTISVSPKRFLIYKNRKRIGVILRKSKTYRKVKRMTLIWLKKYRLFGILFHGTEYWRSRCMEGMQNIKKSNFLKPAI